MRLGIDLGGTKIEGIVLADDGAVVAGARVATPADGYSSVLRAIADLVGHLERSAGGRCSIGVGTPGFLSPRTGLISNSNLTALNGHAVDRDLAETIGRAVRVDNDANCFVLSEATDGAAALPTLAAAAGAVARKPGGIDVVFGATLGTGVGGGIVIDGRVHGGANGSAAEWSHTTLPFLQPTERSPYACFCGRPSCIESFVSGRGLAGAYSEVTGQTLPGPEVGRLAAAGDAPAGEALAIYADRLARALAGVINLLDPRVIVLGGGVSNNARLFDLVPRLWNRYRVADDLRTDLVPARHGDASGVRGAACLWPV
ncbi:MAG TPA: ROK family protein [Polyangia bacterium]|nr:ROK family protein [Polyangia bacterium]